ESLSKWRQQTTSPPRWLRETRKSWWTFPQTRRPGTRCAMPGSGGLLETRCTTAMWKTLRWGRSQGTVSTESGTMMVTWSTLPRNKSGSSPRRSRAQQASPPEVGAEVGAAGGEDVATRRARRPL
ncbi:unnamed protein product, partial [Polarella glacialis]